MSAPEKVNISGWRSALGWTAALVMAAVWLSAGLWKLSDISGWQLKLTQLLIPAGVSLPATLAVATSEVFIGLLLLAPRWRRLGGWLSTALLLVFMLYIGVNYETLQGEDCSCFPWLERAVGPAFFWSDAAMIAASLAAAWLAPAVAGLRRAAWLLGGVVVFGAVMLGYDHLKPAAGAEIPETITADGKQYRLAETKAFLYFFNPSCLHCLDVGIELAEYDWKVDFIGIPTQDFEFGAGFLEDAGLDRLQNVKLSPDLKTLKETFPFEDVPYAAAVENGRVLERMMFFEQPALEENLRRLGLIE